MKTILMLTSLIAASAFAQDKGGNGGDTLLLNKAEVYNYVTQQLKAKLQETLNYIVLKPKVVDVMDEGYLSQLKGFMDQGLLKNVQSYELDPYHSVCIDNQGAEKGMVFEPNDEKGKICVAPEKILKSGFHSASDLVGLLYHEHLHGFGIEDKDHLAGAFAKKYFLKMLTADRDSSSPQKSSFQFLDLEVAKKSPWVTVEIDVPVFYWASEGSSTRRDYAQITYGTLGIFRGEKPNRRYVPLPKSEAYLEAGDELYTQDDHISFSNMLDNAVKNLTAKKKDREETLCPAGTILTQSANTYICALLKIKFKIASSFLQPGDEISILGHHENVPNEDPLHSASSTKPFAPVTIRVYYGESSEYLEFTEEKELLSLKKRGVAFPFQNLWTGNYYTRTKIPVGQILR